MIDDKTPSLLRPGLERRVHGLLGSPIALISPTLALLGLALSALLLLPMRRAARVELPGWSLASPFEQQLLLFSFLSLGLLTIAWLLGD
jgi:hypothetical protein